MKKTNISFKAIALSLIFLFNPNINIIDPLPDFIGYILISFFIIKLSDMNDTLTEALAIFKRLIFIDAAKILAIFWTFGMTVTTERNTSLLLWTFVFALLEIIFVTQAFAKLFSGIHELATLSDSHAVLGGGKRTYTDRIKRFTIVFICLKAILCVLPEFSVLTTTGYDEGSGLMYIYRFIGVMRLLAFIPVAVLGVIWLIKVIRYFARIDRDKEFLGGLDRIYSERVLSKKSIFIKRNVKICYALLICVFLLSIDFRVDHVNILPDVLSAVCLIAFFAVAAKRTRFSRIPLIVLSSVYAALCGLAWALEFHFFKEYYYEAIYRSDEAFVAYVRLCVASGVGILFFFVLSMCVLFVMHKIIRQHTGIEQSLDVHNNAKYREIDEATKRELSRKLIICVVASLAYAAANVCYLLFFADYGFLTMIDIVASLTCSAVYVKVYADVVDAVDSRYMLE